MNPERKEFLSLLGLPPARMAAQEAAWYLGFACHDIPILISAGLLKPLGKPSPNGAKYFATIALANLREDAQWLARASDAVTRYWKSKSERRTKQ